MGEEEEETGFGLTEGCHVGLFLSLDTRDNQGTSPRLTRGTPLVNQSSGRQPAPEPEPEPESGGPLLPLSALLSPVCQGVPEVIRRDERNPAIPQSAPAVLGFGAATAGSVVLRNKAGVAVLRRLPRAVLVQCRKYQANATLERKLVSCPAHAIRFGPGMEGFDVRQSHGWGGDPPLRDLDCGQWVGAELRGRLGRNAAAVELETAWPLVGFSAPC